MLAMTSEQGREIFDNLCLLVDGKRASAWTAQSDPFLALEELSEWSQQENNSRNESSRTDAFLLGYCLFTGGMIPMRGIRFLDGYVRPDAWVIGALLKAARLSVDDAAKSFVVTKKGWDRVCLSMEC